MAASNPHNEPGPSDPTLDSVLSSAQQNGANEAAPADEDGAGLPQADPPLPASGATIQMPTFSASNRTKPLGEKLARNPKAQQLGAEPPDMPELGEGGEKGEKSPGFDTIRGASDVAGAMVTYQNQLMSVLTTMQKLLLEGIARLEALEAYFDRLR